jgi:hypothetical protein
LITCLRPVAVRDAKRVERRLAPGLGQQDPFDGRNVLDDSLRELDLDLGDADTHQPDRPGRGGDRAVDVGIVVAEQRRPEGGVVIGVRVPVTVGERRAARRRDHELLEAGHTALAAVDAAGNDGRCAGCEV